MASLYNLLIGSPKFSEQIIIDLMRVSKTNKREDNV